MPVHPANIANQISLSNNVPLSSCNGFLGVGENSVPEGAAGTPTCINELLLTLSYGIHNLIKSINDKAPFNHCLLTLKLGVIRPTLRLSTFKR